MDMEVRKLRAVIRDLGGSLGSYSWALTDYGYNRLGNGSFAQVVEYPGDPTKVIKIGDDLEDGYLPFATYAFLNPAPCFPKIYSMHVEAKFFMVVMERLSPYYDKHPYADYTDLKSLPEVRAMEKLLGAMDDFDGRNCLVRTSDGSRQLVITDGYYRSSRHKKDYYPQPCGDGCALEERRRVLNGPTISTEPRENGYGDPVRAQEKIDALRLQPFPRGVFDIERMERVLPPLPDHVLAPKAGQRGPYRIAAKGPNEQELKRAHDMVGEHQRLVGRRADMFVMDDVALARRDFADLERRVLMDMAQGPWARDFAAREVQRFIHARRFATPRLAPTAEPEVPNQAPRTRKPDVRVQDRKGFAAHWDWWRRQDKLPRGLRGCGGRT